MGNKKFYILTLSKARDIKEIIEVATSDFNCSGVEEFSLDESEVDEILGERAYSGGDLPDSLLDEVDRNCSKQYKFYFNRDECVKDVEKFRKYLEKSHDEVSIEIKEADWEDWNEKWREAYQTIVVSPELSIVPSWEKKENNPNELYIYPGMGFGTGGHETTYLCLKHFEEIRREIVKGDLCLDFGCGSGILGIAGIKKSNMIVDFCDIDTNALDNCVQNLEINLEKDGCDRHRLVKRERFRPLKKYKLVFANILENILIDEKETILGSLEKNGFLIISGILTYQVETIKKKYSKLCCLDVLSRGDWSSILFKRKN